MKRVCRPQSCFRLSRWPNVVHSLLAMGLLGSGCAAGGADPAADAAAVERGTSAVSNSSSMPATTAGSSIAPSAPSTAASPPTTSVNEAPALSTLTPSGASQGNANLDEDDQDDDIDDDVDQDDDDIDDDDADDDDDDADDDDDVGVTPVDPGAGTPDPSATPVTFTSDIRALLVDNCGRCHASGGLPNFASANAATAFDVAVSERNAIVREITSGSMPADTCNGAPGTAGCVSTQDLALIRAWIAAGTPE